MDRVRVSDARSRGFKSLQTQGYTKFIFRLCKKHAWLSGRKQLTHNRLSHRRLRRFKSCRMQSLVHSKKYERQKRGAGLGTKFVQSSGTTYLETMRLNILTGNDSPPNCVPSHVWISGVFHLKKHLALFEISLYRVLINRENNPGGQLIDELHFQTQYLIR